MLNEELLAGWLHLCGIADNHRLAEVFTGKPDLPFNEAMVCGLLASGRCHTASELCAETRILKSQMNAILRSLEQKGMICRRRSLPDRRRVEIRLSPDGEARYSSAHRQTLDMVGRLIAVLGEEQARNLVVLLARTADAFDQVLNNKV